MKELYEKYVGKEGYIKLNTLKIRVKVLDVKLSYGHERYQITPLAGEGEIWVEEVLLD